MQIETSVGEVVDKITILKIKEQKIKDPEKLVNILAELTLLREEYYKLHDTLDADTQQLLVTLSSNLAGVNLRLWQIEDWLREKESRKEFDEDFIQFARSVYVYNDMRAKIKYEINKITKSKLVEEKSYAGF